RAARLEAEMRQRHVAGAQVEVGGERTDADERRGHHPLLPLRSSAARSDRARLGDAAHPVAGDAALPEQVAAQPHQGARRRGGRPRGDEREQREEEGGASHPCLHAASMRLAVPSSTTISRKITFATIAAALKKWMRVGFRAPAHPSSGGPSPNSAPRVPRNARIAQISAATMKAIAT